MKKKNPPQTSIDAYKALTPEMLAGHHGKIITGLQKLGSATYEELANHLTMDKHQIGRRLSELERIQVVYKPGTTKPTKSNRKAFVYTLRPTFAKTEKKKAETDWSKVREEDFWPTLQNEPLPSRFVQPELFGPVG